MADWQKSELKDFEELKALSEAGTNAIELVNGGLAVVQAAGEAAKLFLLGTVNPALLALIVAADAMIDTLQNFKESGLFIVQVNPFEQPYGAKDQNIIGIEIEKDSSTGLAYFSKSRVTNPRSPFFNQEFEVGDNYRKTLVISDLDSNYRDSNGVRYGESNFVPPIPQLSKDLNLVPGGYNPATWTGTKPSIEKTDFGVPLPTLTAPDCIELLAAAFEDEGDVPRFILNNTSYTGDAYTFSGEKFPITDTTALLPQELYRSSNTSISTTSRERLTTLVSSGKPNYQGNTELTGISVSALAMVVTSQNPKEWVDQITKVLNLFGSGFEDFKKQMLRYADQLSELTLPVDTIRVRLDNRYGGGDYKVGDFVKGKTSGCIGKIESIRDTKPSVMKRKSYRASVLSPDAAPDPDVPIDVIPEETIDGNANNYYTDATITVKNYSGLTPIKNWEVGERIFQAEMFKLPDDEVLYDYKYKDAIIQSQLSGRPVPDAKKPKRAIVINQFATVPDSETPNFYSYRLADLIPGYGDFFDDMINIAESIKAFAEGVLEAIQIIIDAIDDLVEYFEEIASNIIALIELLTQGLPNAGVWFMGMTSQNGSDAFASALRSAGNAPDDTYKISAGFCFVGAPQFDPDPVKRFFSALGVKYQSVG